MTPWRRWAFAVALVLAPYASCPAPAEDEAIEARKRDLAGVEQRVQDLEQDLEARRGRRQSLLAELERRERDIADLANAGRQLEAMIREQERALGELEAQLESERRELQRQRADLGDLLRSAYAMGRGDRIRMLLNQEDVARLSRVMSYYGSLNRYRTERIEDVTARARRLEGLSREAAEETERLSRLAGRQDDTRLRLLAANAERTTLLAALDQTISTEQERVADLRADAEGLRQLVEHLERRARALPEAEVRQESIADRRGRLVWPLQGGNLRARFGRPKGDGGQQWDGVVIAVPEGAEVRAVHHGRVAYADWLRGFGLLIIIEHDDGYMTLYGHNQTLLKEQGEWVAADDVIALSGGSGGRQSAGLYFAIRHDGRPLNPEHWCQGRSTAGRRWGSASGPGVASEAAEHTVDSSIQQSSRARGRAEKACSCDSALSRSIQVAVISK
ncbi:MAG: peptidoglycan DD-metalloendopeptidase family protein [Pseudomonadota bacterium]|nr:peptidoglycan DD-metalloendopeptidase family protein [Pseudomonadota bacterium]